MCWDKQHMRKAFRERLTELDSPWLRVIQRHDARVQRQKAREAEVEAKEVAERAGETYKAPPSAHDETADDFLLEATRLIECMDSVGGWEISELLEKCKRMTSLGSNA